jgi:hypothetical protein
VFDDLESYQNAPMWPVPHYPVAIPAEGIEGISGVNTLQPLAWINNYGEGRSKVTMEGPDRRGERRFLPWPYYNHQG